MAIHGKTTKAKIEAGVEDRKEFTAGNISGRQWKTTDTGWLPAEWRDLYRKQEVIFTFLSYRTPIAWMTTDGVWYLPAVKYSVSTTGQQSAVRYALLGHEVIETVPANV